MLMVATLPMGGRAESPADDLSKVQFVNIAGVEPTADGTGLSLSRAPKELRDQLVEKNPSTGKTAGDALAGLIHSEIRFVPKPGQKPAEIKVKLKTDKAAFVSVFWGDVYCGEVRLAPGKVTEVTPLGHGLLYSLMEKLPRERYANDVCRLVMKGDVSFHGIEGDVRPPNPDELPPVMLAYGTSITSGHAATRTDLSWASLTARKLGYDLLNLGTAGTAFLEKPMVDYLAGLKWDLCVLEISVNMTIDAYTPEEFRKRAEYLVDSLAKSNPNSPIVCISVLPWGVGDYWKTDEAAKKTEAYRKILEEICANSSHKNVRFVDGTSLLSMSGLAADMLHPSDFGMIEISDKLSEKIHDVARPRQ